MEAFCWIPVSWYSFWQLCQSTTSQQVASLSSEDHLAFVVQGQILWAIFAHICLPLMLFQKRNKDCLQARSTISTVKCFKKGFESSNDFELRQLPHRSKSAGDFEAPGYQRWKSAPWRSAKGPTWSNNRSILYGLYVGVLVLENGLSNFAGNVQIKQYFRCVLVQHYSYHIISHWSCQD